MKKVPRRIGFVLGDSLLGLLIVSVATLTFAQAQSMIIKTASARAQQVDRLRMQVEMAWLKEPSKIKQDRLKPNEKLRPSVKNADQNRSVDQVDDMADSTKIQPLKGGDKDDA